MKRSEQRDITPSQRKPLSTGMKMLLILALALLPLGLIAVFASIESAHVNRLRHEAEATSSASASALALTTALRQGPLQIRTAINDLILSSPNGSVAPRLCRERLQQILNEEPYATGAAIMIRNGKTLCATPGYSGLTAYGPAERGDVEVRLAGQARLLRAIVGSDSGSYFGVIEYGADKLAPFIARTHDHHSGVTLFQGSQRIELSTAQPTNPLERIVRVATPVANGQMSLELKRPVSPFGTLEVVLVLLPILMWAAGALIGWLVVERLILLPLAQIQKAVADFNRGAGPLVIPKVKTPAHEIRQLGESFIRATDALTRHEEELAEALDRQKKLTREVHHRVKNNLQVVSSLINLHARGASSDEVRDAYASIQRRVDALAVVHRNHFAELEENLGVSLRALIGEIATGLRVSAEARGDKLRISLDLAPLSAHQDVAMPVAFLITELLELVAICGTDPEIDVTLQPAEDDPKRALLTISSPALAEDSCREGPRAQRFQRIVGGLARQLRSGLMISDDHTSYSIRIAILESPRNGSDED